MRVLCIGMMVCDIFLAPIPSDILKLDSTSIERPKVSCGGDALNVAIGARKLGLDISVCGRIAEDYSGNQIHAACRTLGIDQRGLLIDSDASTATSYVLLDEAGERHFLSNRAIFSRMREDDVPDALIESADFVYFGSAMAMREMNRGGLAALFRRAKACGKTTILDAAIADDTAPSGWMAELSEAFSFTDYFLPSISEAFALTGETEPHEIAERFRTFGMKAFAVKLGKRGCYITDFRQEALLPPPGGLHVVDTTGAGDSFVAGFLRGLAEGWTPFRCAAFANCVAGRNLEAIGGTAGIPTFDNALAYYHKTYTTEPVEKEGSTL